MKPRRSISLGSPTQTPLSSATGSLSIPLNLLCNPRLTKLQAVVASVIKHTGNPEQATIAQWIHVSKRAVADAVRVLSEEGILVVMPKGAGRGNAYVVIDQSDGVSGAGIIGAMEKMELSQRRAAASESSAWKSSAEGRSYQNAVRSWKEEEVAAHNARIDEEWNRLRRQ